MEINNVIDEVYSRFEISDDGEVLGELSYDIPFDDRLVIKHTSVSPEYSGRGLGKKLIKEVVNYAKEKNLAVVPVCSYAAKMKTEHPELYE
ncbi:N-acetyltransferase [Hyphobacterium sp. CCMP332]|nr:N-acetyltransferase [Hyphobacterium sp. CCMP332]